MPTAKKAAVIEELTDKLGRINAAALIEYRGLNVAEISDLRNQLRRRDIELQVTKNTLLREAAHRNNMENLDDLFAGPTAVAFIYGDEAAGTKALNDYFRTARVGEIKSGILRGGRKVSAEQFVKLADLPNRQTLLAQIAGLFESPLSQLAALFNAPAQQLAYAIAALEDKGGAAGAGVTAAPATDSAPAATEAPAAAEPATPEAATAAPEADAPEATAVAPEATAAAPDVAAPEAAPAPLADASATADAPDVSETAAPQPAQATEVTAEPAAEAPQATAAPAAAAASDVTSAPEEDGGAANAAPPTTDAGAEPLSGQEAAADPSFAPESEGSADAQP